MNIGRILVVEDDESLRRVTQAQLEKCGYETAVARDVPEALEILEEEPRDLIITDLNLPGPSGMELLKQVRLDYPETTVVVVTAYGTIETAVEAMRAGAYDYITKPVHPDELRALVSRVLERRQLIEEVCALRSSLDQKYGFENIIGRSSALLQVLDSASRVAHTDATVLLLAKAIHFISLRRQRPFVVINCGAIPAELLESELFGHVKGSFTGAMTHKKGKVEIADGGTLFLDEIGEMSLDLQVRVLRLLQEREIEKVGATKLIRVDVRIIAATHRNLEMLVADGQFREDLYYRLAVIPLLLPPLRDRPGDIPELINQLFERSKLRHDRPDLTLSAAVMPCLVNYRWPGNVRELENVIERLVLLCRGDEVGVADLPANIRQRHPSPDPPAPAPAITDVGLNAVERHLIVKALRECNWNQTQAARQLAISRKTLLYRMGKHGITKDEGEGSMSSGGGTGA
jgi:DNA-binding NtrC family response regulator